MIIKNKNKKNLTIDLKEIIAKDYLYSKKTNMHKLTETFVKYVAICGIIWFIIVSLVGWGILNPVKKVNASQGQILSIKDKIRLERLEVCQNAFDKYKKTKKYNRFIRQKTPVVSCAIRMH